MPEVYRPRHPERTVLYRVLFHYFDRFLAEYESRFEKEYGFLRPIVKEVVERYLDCGNPRCGFARIRCPDCGEERLLMFSCRTRGFCPSCHSKRLEEWGEWMRETLLLDVPHRQVVFTIPKMLRLFFKYKRRLLGGSAGRQSGRSSNTSRPQPAQNSSLVWWPSSSRLARRSISIPMPTSW